MLPCGSVGGVTQHGSIPWDGAPLFTATMALAEMPWRAAGGEAHSMTATQCWDSADDHTPPLIFDQLLKETVSRTEEPDDQWDEQQGDQQDEQWDDEQDEQWDEHWAHAPTASLLIVEPRKAPLSCQFEDHQHPARSVQFG